MAGRGYLIFWKFKVGEKMTENFEWEDLDKDGLTFLMENRKEVVKNYQKMVLSLGKSLDDKTRQLIMLAIQVNSPSPEAIKIIIPKALKAGATRDEIIDTIILTIPIVGLSTVLKMLPFVLKELESMEKIYNEINGG
ncbi:MAG: carboxymuconolactone decarboxylase family protein [Candidatus Marinimicrobia bacterium]|nr:carboxymuconolactone decarboxylase family protein [Candidatus Neomarinimicrobiota bacterium]